MPRALTARDILASFGDLRLDAENATYVAYHARRYARLLQTVDRCLPARSEATILDVGPSFQTRLMQERYPEARVSTLGFAHPHFPPSAPARHVELDLNDAGADPAPEPGDAGHDVVTMGEVIEHLHTAPEVVLGYLRTWLVPGGALILQTPNAVALHKRLRMAAGRNPLEPIRREALNPGHFHEYTAGELGAAAGGAGLRVQEIGADNYFGNARAHRAYGAAARVLPPTLRHGLTAILRRPDAD